MSMEQPVQQGIQVILDPMTWVWLQISVWAFVLTLIGMIAAIAFHFISEFRTPLESKSIRNGSHRRRSGLLLAGDDGLGEIKITERLGNEGYAVTRPEGKWKFHWTGVFPRRGKVPTSIQVSEGHDQDKTMAMAELINELNTKKLFLKGARIPMWVGVKSKAILMSVYAIAAIQMTEKLQTAFYEFIADKSELNATYFPIDIPALKEMVVKTSYNQSQLNAIESDSEHIGEERVKKGEILNKLVLIAGIAFAALGLLGLALSAYL